MQEMKIFMHIEDKTIKENFFKNLDTTFFKARDFDMEIVEDLDLDVKWTQTIPHNLSK